MSVVTWTQTFLISLGTEFTAINYSVWGISRLFHEELGISSVSINFWLILSKEKRIILIVLYFYKILKVSNFLINFEDLNTRSISIFSLIKYFLKFRNLNQFGVRILKILIEIVHRFIQIIIYKLEYNTNQSFILFITKSK